ncbi:LIC_12616 family protein [Rummeliibacillus stabekisii]|uniref:Phage neck terminator protein gp12-like domain-containing protein n=1 Tax=Rummeliibacillus stabekisii TaxID=241244 RepID=A0A143HG10_9BACL|nr:hypothetical protein [Rummeliibacillus stabekisii]AMX00417.1 hypothetical protein ATY39_13950 [Rummeliibacillus stabekisii]
MLDIEPIRSTIVRNLKETTGIQTIIAEQSNEQPSYPFIAIKFTTLGKQVGRATQYMKENGQHIEQDIEMVLSVSSFSEEMDESINNAYAAFQFFEVDGIQTLQEANIAVVKTTEITNRDTFISIEYERRTGFDVRIRTRAHSIREHDSIDTININN